MVHQKSQRKTRHILKIPERQTPSETSSVDKTEVHVSHIDKSGTANQIKDDAFGVMNEYYQSSEKHDDRPGMSANVNCSEKQDFNQEESIVSDAIPEPGKDEEESGAQQSFFIQSQDDDSSRSSNESGCSDSPCITKFECVLCDMVFELVDEFIEHVDSHSSGVGVRTEAESLNEQKESYQDGSHVLPAFEIPNEDVDNEESMDKCQDKFSNTVNQRSPDNGDDQNTVNPPFLKLDHVKKGKLKKMYLCRYCGKKFMGERFLKDHLVTFYNNVTEKATECMSHQKLKEISNVDELSENIRLHMYSVEYGSSGKKSSKSQQSDDLKGKKKAKRLYKKCSCECKHCGKTFVNKNRLRSHLIGCLHCPDNERNIISDDDVDEEPLKKKNDVELPCTRCNRVFDSAEDLIKHRETTHNTKCPNEDDNTEYFCAHCNKQCPSQAKLYSHLQTHRYNKRERKKDEYESWMTINKETNEWVCNICEKSYSNKSNLRRHISLHDINERKDYKCPFCSRVFQYQRYLQHHIGYMHKSKEEKEHECFVCGLTCTTKSSLKRHMMLHTGDLERTKVFECDTCHKKFKYKKELENHIQYHLDERPYPCDKCDYRARTYFNLMNHSGIHLHPKKRKRKISSESTEQKAAKIEKRS